MLQKKRPRDRQKKLLEIQIMEMDLQVAVIAIILIQIVDQVVIAILVKVAILHLVVAVVKLDHQVLHLIMIINMKFGSTMVMVKNIIIKMAMVIFTIPMVDILEI